MVRCCLEVRRALALGLRLPAAADLLGPLAAVHAVAHLPVLLPQEAFPGFLAVDLAVGVSGLLVKGILALARFAVRGGESTPHLHLRPVRNRAAGVVAVADAANVEDAVAIGHAVAVGAGAVVAGWDAALVVAGVAVALADAADVRQRAGAERVVAVLLPVAAKLRDEAQGAGLQLRHRLVVVPALAARARLVSPAVLAVRVEQAPLPALVRGEADRVALPVEVRLPVAHAAVVAHVLEVAGGVVAV